MNVLKYIISVLLFILERRLTAVEAIRNVPGVSIMVPIKKNTLKVVKLAVIQSQIDESTIFFFFNLRFKIFETNYEIVELWDFAVIVYICLKEILFFFISNILFSTLFICYITLQSWLAWTILSRTFQYGLKVLFLKPKAQSQFMFCLLVQIKLQFQNLFYITLRHKWNKIQRKL